VSEWTKEETEAVESIIAERDELRKLVGEMRESLYTRISNCNDAPCNCEHDAGLVKRADAATKKEDGNERPN